MMNSVVKFDPYMSSIQNDEALEMRSKLEKKDADPDQLNDILQQLLDRVSGPVFNMFLFSYLL
jgi:hypothetical protein